MAAARAIILTLVALSLSAGAALAEDDAVEIPPPPAGTPRTVTLIPQDAAAGQVMVTASQVNYPGLSERSSCRMRFQIENQSASPITFRGIFDTRIEGKDSLNAWVVHVGRLDAGKSTERVFSCRGANILGLREQHEWPAACTTADDCRLALRLVSNLGLDLGRVAHMGKMATP